MMTASRSNAKSIPAYVAKYEERIERLFNQTRTKISVSNIGKIQAEHLLVEVRVSSGWIHDRYVLSSPGGPNVPKPRDNTFFVPDVLRNSQSIPLRVGRHDVAYQDSPAWNSSFSATCEDFRHGQEWTFDGVLGIDSRTPDTKIIVSVTASNYRGKSHEVRSVERTLNTVTLKDVVDFDSLKLIADVPITQVIRRKDYKTSSTSTLLTMTRKLTRMRRNSAKKIRNSP